MNGTFLLFNKKPGQYPYEVVVGIWPPTGLSLVARRALELSVSY